MYSGNQGLLVGERRLADSLALEHRLPSSPLLSSSVLSSSLLSSSSNDPAEEDTESSDSDGESSSDSESKDEEARPLLLPCEPSLASESSDSEWYLRFTADLVPPPLRPGVLPTVERPRRPGVLATLPRRPGV